MGKRKNWDEIWEEYHGLNWLGRRLSSSQKKTVGKILSKINLGISSKIIDMGCGKGFTLHHFRSLGYKNSIGVDKSENSIRLCESLFGFRLGKDVFQMDCRKTDFKSGSFDLVFSEGMLEHFQDFSPFVKEMARLSGKYILIFQPNPTSLFGEAKRFFQRIGVMSWEFEFFYDKYSYMETFENFGFRLVDSGGINLGEEMWLLFEKLIK
jgi:SAM-dependent methyltransferase